MSDISTNRDRIAQLEARLAKAERRIADLEAKAPLGIIQPREVDRGTTPSWEPPWIVTCKAPK